VRQAATHVTGTNDEDGVAQAIDDILLPLAR
jgi:hydroxymethylpyrimidine pyrophosphatase-like HAD family hydrolase